MYKSRINKESCEKYNFYQSNKMSCDNICINNTLIVFVRLFYNCKKCIKMTLCVKIKCM